jgi:heterodisulfide reductase subunit A-like polyferredoxin
MFAKNRDLFFTESDHSVYTLEMDRDAAESKCLNCTNCMELCRRSGEETLTLSAQDASDTPAIRKCISDGMCLMACSSKRLFTRNNRSHSHIGT